MENENPAVSVIIPLYNAEKYIGECLTSIVNQTFQDFEIVIADDCSTDNSRAVVENFFANFGDRLKLLRLPKNSGCSGVPRNFALKEARGKYVFFVDNDDLLNDTALEDFYKVAEDFNADVVYSEKCLSFDDEHGAVSAEITRFQSGKYVTEPTLETFDINERMTGFVRQHFSWWPWDKLFRRQFLIDNNVTFPALRRFEDFVFTLKYLVVAKNFVRVPFVNYFYRSRENSPSHRAYDVLEIVQDMIDIFRTLDEFMSGNKFFRDNPQHKYEILNFFIGGQLDLTVKGFFNQNDVPTAAIYNYLREKIFSLNPQDNVALTSYLFIAVNILRLQTSRQASEINDLKRQLAALKNNLEVTH